MGTYLQVMFLFSYKLEKMFPLKWCGIKMEVFWLQWISVKTASHLIFLRCIVGTAAGVSLYRDRGPKRQRLTSFKGLAACEPLRHPAKTAHLIPLLKSPVEGAAAFWAVMLHVTDNHYCVRWKLFPRSFMNYMLLMKTWKLHIILLENIFNIILS